MIADGKIVAFMVDDDAYAHRLYHRLLEDADVNLTCFPDSDRALAVEKVSG